MENKSLILLIVVLVIAVAGAGTAFFALNEAREASEDIPEIGGLESTVDRIDSYTPPYVYTGNPVSLIFEFENDRTFYFGSDTGLNAEMETVVNRYHDPDAAFIPIGNFYTMDHEAGAFAASLIEPSDYIIPNHYASFPILEQDPDDFFDEVEKYNLAAETKWMEMGETEEITGVDTTWLGHGNWLFETPEGMRFLVDPQIEWNVNYPEEEWGDLEEFEQIDMIVLTHGHFDHTTIEDLQTWEEHFDPIVVAPFELGLWLRDYLDSTTIPINMGANISRDEIIGYKEGILGFEEEDARELEERIPEDFNLHFINATHSSSGTPPEEDPVF